MSPTSLLLATVLLAVAPFLLSRATPADSPPHPPSCPVASAETRRVQSIVDNHVKTKGDGGVFDDDPGLDLVSPLCL